MSPGRVRPFVRQLDRTARAVQRGLQSAAAPGLRPERVAVLVVLLRAEEPLPPMTIAAAVGAAPNALSSLLHGLEEAGFVTRRRDRPDGRGVSVRLTPSGRRVAHACAERERAFYRALARSVSADEFRHAEAVLAQLEAGASALAARRKRGNTRG